MSAELLLTAAISRVCASGRWVRCGKAPGGLGHPEFQVTDLIPGQDYKFRVAAVNDEGESEPLETEKATKAKNPYGTCASAEALYVAVATVGKFDNTGEKTGKLLTDMDRNIFDFNIGALVQNILNSDVA